MNHTKNRDHLNLLCDIGDLAALLSGSENIGSFLQRAVAMVADHLDAPVCSIYLYEEDSEELVLKATIGLNPASVGKVRMKIGEGLVGATMEKMQPIREGSAGLNPNYKYFAVTEEDRFHSFLAAPIQRGIVKIGVLAIQHEAENHFDEIDVMALRAISSQLAGAIENARLLMNLNRQKSAHSLPAATERLKLIKGETAVEGFAFAPARVFGRSDALVNHENGSGIQYTLQDFITAVEKTGDELVALQESFSQRLPETASLIFTAHFMILKDRRFIHKIRRKIEKGVNPPQAIREVARHFISIFASSPHPYMREKTSDIKDLTGRLLLHLTRQAPEDTVLYRDSIVIARELYPSDVLILATEGVRGIILVRGGLTSHVSILSRSLKIPLIIADRSELLDLADDTPILMDAHVGNIYVNPSDDVVDKFTAGKDAAKTSKPLSASPITRTKDGVRVHLMANINLLSELPLARDLNAEGVGLYRTEFPFLIRANFPSEEEQYHVYKRIFEEMPDRQITIRTLDIGGEKALSYYKTNRETNPELGLRSIRFTLRNRDIFEQQIRAILRAGAKAENLRILFPMISSVDEFRQARQMVFDCMTSLSQTNLGYHRQPEIGMMVELPSVIEIIDDLAMETDFFSIGTNDLVQYMLAVDRANESVADYYQACHPAVLRSLGRIVEAAVRRNVDISMCGEMARELEYIPFLLGIGLRKFSVDPVFLPRIQRKIASVTLEEARRHAQELLSEPTIKGVRKMLYWFGKSQIAEDQKDEVDLGLETCR